MMITKIRNKQAAVVTVTDLWSENCSYLRLMPESWWQFSGQGLQQVDIADMLTLEAAYQAALDGAA